MKLRRQAYILHILNTTEIETQDQLLEHLHEAGFKVTQATVSRDIKELRLAKVSNGKGGYKYALPQSASKGDLNRRARRVFEDYVKAVDFSGNILIIKTYPGGANAVGAVIDELNWEGVVGTLAGDDVFLIIVRSEDERHMKRPPGKAGEIFDRLQELMI